MITLEEFKILLPLAYEWAKEQEKRIIKNGVKLNDDQQIDAYLIGIKDPRKIRLLKVNSIPMPDIPQLKKAVEFTRLLSPNTIGVTFRYGICIRADFWDQRRLVAHELSHVMQYERMGGFEPFIEQYLHECITVGYPFGPLEQEAKRIENEICTQH